LTRKEYKQAFFISFVASCNKAVLVDRYRELQIKALGKSTYDYVIDYLIRKRLYPPKPFMNTVDDWFRYSWLVIANSEPVVYWVGKRINELLDLGVPPDEITLTAKWAFDVKAKRGSKWVTIAHRDPIITAGLPYWVGFNQVYGNSNAVWGCPGNPPHSWATGGFCTTCGLDSGTFGIYFAGGGKPPSSIQAGVGTDCCTSPTGYNLNSPSMSFSVTVDNTGTKNISTWSISGVTTVSVSGPYIVLLIATHFPGESFGVISQDCFDACVYEQCSPSGGCGCASGYYSNIVAELIYENLGTLSIASNTSISASIQLIIAVASPG
jgi:hypothetical protein